MSPFLIPAVALIVCLVACLILGRGSRWYPAAWLPLFLVSVGGCIAAGGVFFTSTGSGPEGGFAALGRGMALLMLVPVSVPALIVCWLSRPKNPSTALVSWYLGAAVTGLGFVLATHLGQSRVIVEVRDSYGVPVQNCRVAVLIAGGDGIKPIQDCITDVHGRAKVRLKLPQYGLTIRSWSSGTLAQAEVTNPLSSKPIVSYRWEENPFYLNAAFQNESSEPLVVTLYLRSGGQLQSRAVEERIQQTLQGILAGRSRSDALEHLGGCFESLPHLPLLQKIAETHPSLLGTVASTLHGQAALIQRAKDVLSNYRERLAKGDQVNATRGIQALAVWATNSDELGESSLLEIEEKLNAVGERVLETSLPFVGDAHGTAGVFAELKSLSQPFLPRVFAVFPTSTEQGQMGILRMANSLRLNFDVLEPLTMSANPRIAMSALRTVHKWKSREELDRALAIVEAKEREVTPPRSPDEEVQRTSQFNFVREQIAHEMTKFR